MVEWNENGCNGSYHGSKGAWGYGVLLCMGELQEGIVAVGWHVAVAAD